MPLSAAVSTGRCNTFIKFLGRLLCDAKQPFTHLPGELLESAKSRPSHWEFQILIVRPRLAQNTKAGKRLTTHAARITHHGISAKGARLKTYPMESTISAAIKKNIAKLTTVFVDPENRN